MASQVQQPRARLNSITTCSAPRNGPVTPREASPTRSLLRSVQRRSTLDLKQDETQESERLPFTSSTNKASTGREYLRHSISSTTPVPAMASSLGRNRATRPSTAARVSLSNAVASLPGPPPAPSAAITRRRSAILLQQQTSMSTPAGRQAERNAGEAAKSTTTSKPTPRLSGRASQEKVTGLAPHPRITTRASTASLKSTAKVTQAPSPFRNSPRTQPSPSVSSCGQEDVSALRARIAKLEMENENLASMLAEARMAQSDAEARIEASRIEAARCRDEANAALLSVQEHHRLREAAEGEAASLRRSIADDAMAYVSVASLGDTSSLGVSASVDALRAAAESGQGLTREAARALEREFAAQERILRAFQHDNEAKTKAVETLTRQKTKLETFCAKYFDDEEWQRVVYGDGGSSRCEDASKAGVSRLCDVTRDREQENATPATQDKHNHDSTSQDSITTGNNLRTVGEDDAAEHEDVASPLASIHQRALRPRELNLNGNAPWPACSSPIKSNARQGHNGHASPVKVGSLLRTPGLAPMEMSSFVSATDALDASAWAKAANLSKFSPAKDGKSDKIVRQSAMVGTAPATPVAVDRSILESVIEAQKKLINAACAHSCD